MKQYGLIIPRISTREEGAEHVLGSSSTQGPVINPSGNWIPYLPDKEPQEKNGIETQNCTGFGTMNAVETLEGFKGTKIDHSDRYMGIAATTDPYHGNDPHKVAETLRKDSGTIPEADLPFDDSITTPEAYYLPKPLPDALTAKGNRWYDQWDFAHEWIFLSGTPQEKREKLKDAITKGTVCVSVSAWYFDPARNLYYKPAGAQDNHWCQLANIEDGKYIVFDSYDSYLKDLDPLFDFSLAKVYYLDPAGPKITAIAKLLDLIGRLLNIDALLIQKPPILTNPPKDLPHTLPSIPTVHISRIQNWAKAIQTNEGYYSPNQNPSYPNGSPSYRNNNPGNIKYTPYAVSLGAIGHSADNFAIFPNVDHGFSALMQLLTDACTDQLRAFKSTMTLKEFTQVYACPPNDNYANAVASALKVAVDIQIKELL